MEAVRVSKVAQAKPSEQLMQNILRSLDGADLEIKSDNAQNAPSERRWIFMTPKLMWSAGGVFVLVLLVVGSMTMFGGSTSNTDEFAQAEAEFAQMEDDMALADEFGDSAIDEDLATLAFLDDDNIPSALDSSTAQIAQEKTTVPNSSTSIPVTQIEADIEELDSLDLDLGELDMEDITI